MKVICAMNQKGGAGKTTVLLNLMITARAKGRKTTLIDLDPQRSAEKWADLREIRAKKDEPVIVHALVDELNDILDEARERKLDLVMIDTPAAIDKTMIYAAAAADVIVVPTRTSQLDLDALEETLTTLRNMHALTKAVVVVNAPRTDDKKGGDIAAVRALAENGFNVPVAGVVLADSGEISRALDAGKGIAEKSRSSAAAKAFATLFDWIDKRGEKPTMRIGRSA